MVACIVGVYVASVCVSKDDQAADGDGVTAGDSAASVGMEGA